MHLDNQIAWLDAMKEQSSNFKKIRGLVITGWQRYDHLGTLCELLPVSLCFEIVCYCHFTKVFIIFSVWSSIVNT